MRINNSIRVLLAGVLLVAGLSACGDSDDAVTRSVTTESAADIKVDSEATVNPDSATSTDVGSNYLVYRQNRYDVHIEQPCGELAPGLFMFAGYEVDADDVRVDNGLELLIELTDDFARLTISEDAETSSLVLDFDDRQLFKLHEKTVALTEERSPYKQLNFSVTCL